MSTLLTGLGADDSDPIERYIGETPSVVARTVARVREQLARLGADRE